MYQNRSYGVTPTRRNRKGRSLAVAALLLSSLLPAVAAGAASGAPTPLDTEVTLLSDNFEAASLGSNWTVSDVNATGGVDQWARSSYRAANGNGSAWAAGWGNRTSNNTATVLTEDFEGNVTANWTTYDLDPLSGNDTWGLSSARAHSGSYSYWSAAIGFNDDDGTDTNANLSLYDNDMDTYALRDVTLPGGAPTILSFWYWIDAEFGYDYMFVLLNVSGLITPAQVLNGHAGTTTGWIQSSVIAPAGTTQLILEFDSDDVVVYEGVYIDDIEFVSFDSSPIFTEGFETALAPTWTASDLDSTNGQDYWNRSTTRAVGGSWSAWCAQEGFNDETQADDNRNLSLYDSGMDAVLWRSVDLSNFTAAIMTYYVWLDSEEGYDYVYAAYYLNNQWVYTNGADGQLGPNHGWAVLSALIPGGATRVGVAFMSDTSVVQEGAYVDDVSLVGVPQVNLNVDTHVYDEGMNATMVAPINMGVLSTAQLDYSYWVDTDSSSDMLMVVFRAGGVWTEVDMHSGSSGGWQTSSVQLPPGTDRVGFRFVSTQPGTREGAYIDDVRVFSTIPALLCDLTISSQTGVEGLTQFQYGTSVGGGVGTISLAWDFGDGSSATIASPNHTYAQAGTYNVSLTVTDGYGQVCAPPSTTVDIAHDLSSVLMSAGAPQVVEGQSTPLSATDALGHSFAFDWSLSSAACGLLSANSGPSTTFTSDPDAGGLSCEVTAGFGSAAGHSTIEVLHDVHLIDITPPQALLVEGESTTFSALDANGHGLAFNWSATCGLVVSGPGANEATYTASLGGPGHCFVNASYGGGSASSDVTVTHDMAGAYILADHPTAVEGTEVTLQYLDGADHVLEAVWQVTPQSCGGLAQVTAGEVVLAVDSNAGGQTCDVQGTVGAYPAVATIVVLHDMDGAAISPSTALLVEGGQREFAFVDARGHEVDVTWSLEPTTCGSLAPASGARTTLTLSSDSGGGTCTLRASLGGFEWTSVVTVEHGQGSALAIDPEQDAAVEGGTLTFEATLADAAGHALAASSVGWTTDCGVVSPATGSSTTLTVAAAMGGQECTVVVTYGSQNATATVTVSHAAPFSVTVASNASTMVAGSASAFTATVKDANGHTMAGAVVSWTATCGQLSATTGESVVFTAPDSPGSCSVRATAMVGTVSTEQATFPVEVTAQGQPGPTETGGGLDMVLVGALIAVVVGAGVGLMLWRKSKGGGKSGAAEEQPETK